MQRELAIARSMKKLLNAADGADELQHKHRRGDGRAAGFHPAGSRAVVELRCVELWRNEKEPYRIKLGYMLEKIANTRDESLKGSPKRYNSPDELMEDLQIIDRSLRTSLCGLCGRYAYSAS